MSGLLNNVFSMLLVLTVIVMVTPMGNQEVFAGGEEECLVCEVREKFLEINDKFFEKFSRSVDPDADPSVLQSFEDILDDFERDVLEEFSLGRIDFNDLEDFSNEWISNLESQAEAIESLKKALKELEDTAKKHSSNFQSLG